MNDGVFELYMKATDLLDDKEKKVFKMGFDLGISEGTSRCIDRLNVVNKESKKKHDLLRKRLD